MGCFTQIDDTEYGYVQFNGGIDVCDHYEMGDEVDWYFRKDRPGEGHLLDDVYHSYSEDRRNPYVIIKDHKLIALIDKEDERFLCVCDDDGEWYFDIKKVKEHYNIVPFERSWWSEEQWVAKEKKDEERRLEREERYKVFQEETKNMTPNEQLAYAMAAPLIRSIDYQGWFASILKIE